GLVLSIFVLVAFIGFNLGNSCDVSFGFTALRGVPVFLTALFSFAAGMLVVLPLAFRNARGAKADLKSSRAPGGKRSKGETGTESGSYGID
ncbi:MAG: hypothetical protein A2Z99_11355, partial [Treponema sp. GWB1_62_6]